MYSKPARTVPHDVSVNINLETQVLARSAYAFEIFCAGTYFLPLVGVMTNRALKPEDWICDPRVQSDTRLVQPGKHILSLGWCWGNVVIRAGQEVPTKIHSTSHKWISQGR